MYNLSRVTSALITGAAWPPFILVDPKIFTEIFNVNLGRFNSA